MREGVSPRRRSQTVKRRPGRDLPKTSRTLVYFAATDQLPLAVMDASLARGIGGVVPVYSSLNSLVLKRTKNPVVEMPSPAPPPVCSNPKNLAFSSFFSRLPKLPPLYT